MKYSKRILSLLFSCAIFIAGCKKDAYYQTNPNSPSVTTPALSFTDVENNVFNFFYLDPDYADRHLVYYVFPNASVQYTWTRASGAPYYSFNNYDVLRQVEDMNAAAVKNGVVTYQALAKFFRAVLFIQMTETYGDIPYSQALKAQNGLYTPAYDSQKSIYLSELAELDQANTMLDPSQGTIPGDIIYGGSSNEILQWKQLINAYRLRLLIHLSNKTSDNDLKVVQQFQAIVSNPAKYPLMTSINDNAQLAYNTSLVSNYNPFYLSNDLQSGVSMEKSFVTMLQNFQDPRLFSFAAPVTGKPAGVFSSYVGVDAGLDISSMQNAGASASRINNRYWTSQTNEPYIFLSYAEQEFLIAEAISRGWIAGDAATHYNNGITASMNFYGITGNAVTSYLAQPSVAFSSNNAITQIITQKYISFFANSGWEGFFEQRRTGIPTLDVGPGTQNDGKVPKRWMYPQSELTNNDKNLNAALQAQYSGNDDINGIIWLLK